MKIAAIDIGTNTFLCLIADTSLKVTEDHAKVVRLGEGVNQNGYFLPEALSRAKDCLTEFKSYIDRNKVDKIIATATSAARDASNSKDLIKICEDLKIPLHIIDGQREAELSYAGALSALPDSKKGNILVVDVGGGSTELITKVKNESLKAISYNVGSVRLTEMFLKSDPIDGSELAKLEAYAWDKISGYGHVMPELIIAVAGTPTTLACIEQETDFDEEKVEGHILTMESIETMIKRLSSMPLEKRKAVKGLDPLRADVIVAGSVLLKLALRLAQATEMTVSTRGLRYGVILHYGDFS